LGQILVDEDTNTVTIIGPQSDIASVQKYLAEIDLRPAQVTIETRIIEVALSDLQEMGIEWRLNSGSSSVDVTLPPASSPALTFSYGYLTPGDFTLLLKMLARKGKSNIASAPSITTMNNSKATIESGDKIPVPEETVDGKVVRYTLWPVGISMEVTPQITPDGYIIMDIKPSVRTFKDWAPDGRTPIITERTTQQRVIIRDGDTLAIGGLITEEERRSMSQVPLLSQIPLLGEFFKRTTVEKVKTELVVCLTPHVIVMKEDQSLQVQ
jgi:general secretion pathway protein D